MNEWGLTGGTSEDFFTADVHFDYMRNNGGMRKNVDPDDYSQKVEPWGRYMSENPGTAPQGWEQGNVSFKNPLYMPHEYGAWKQTLSDMHDGATGQALSDALLAKGHDGVVTHDKYGIGEMVDIRPKNQRGHRVMAMPMPTPEGLNFRHHPDAASAAAALEGTKVTAYGPAVTAHLGDDPTPIGSIDWTTERNRHGDEPGQVGFIHVHPDHRRSGVGTAMFNWTKQNVRPDLRHSDERTPLGRDWVKHEQSRTATHRYR